MNSEVPFFYSNNAHSSLANTLPAQALPESRKNTEWFKAVMDSCEQIGLVQLKENLPFVDLYKMKKGELIYSDLVDLPEQLREIEGFMNDMDLPYDLKHYDLIGLITNVLVSHYSKNSDKFVAISNDEFASNEFKRRRSELMNAYVKEQIDKEIEMRLIEQGVDPDKTNFQSEEERQQYLQFIQERKTQMTPPEIEKYMSVDFSTNFVKWANLTLKQDAERHDFAQKDRTNLEDFLLTGRCFRHFRIGWDFYEPEVWSPINTFFSKSLQTKQIEDGEYVGRVHFYTPSEVVNYYGSKLSEKQIKKILNPFGDNIYPGTRSGASYKEIFEKNAHGNALVPHESYFDYNFALQVQEYSTQPLGETEIVGKDGNKVTVPRYLPQRNSQGGYAPNLHLAQQIRSDLKISTNLMQVTEAYWKGFKRVGQLTYQIPETGRVEVATVTDDILEEFLRENEIKKLTNISIEEYEKKAIYDKINTICYTYIPITYEGIKIKMAGTDAKEDIYLGGKPMELQLKGNSNVYDNKLPVAGIIDVSLANILRPYQVGYNFAMNSIQNLSEKEIGILLFFDMKLLPSEYKNFGDSLDDVLTNLVNVGRKTGFFPLDTDRQNLQGQGVQMPISAQNLSLTPQIQNCFERALFYKQAAFEQVGITQQMIGAPTKYETAQGVQVSQDASYAQIERYYDIFGEFKKSALEMQLNVAQYAKKNNKDITVFYTDSDVTTSLLQFTDDNFWLRKLNILPQNNSKKRREVELFKQYILGTNTLADDTLAFAEFTMADTTQEIVSIAKQSMLRRQQQEELAQQRQMEQIQAQTQATDELNQRTWDRTEISKNKDRIVDIQVAEISKAGKESNTNFQKDLFSQTSTLASLQQKDQQAQIQNNLQQQEIDRKRMSDESESEYRERMLRIKERDQDLREKQIQAKQFGDIINKN